MRILLLADTHIGFDLPRRPRITRRRRGHDFLANFRTALSPARRGEVDLVVHGGDLLFRSLVPPATVEMAMEPLVEVAAAGVPVYLVPGNHERSRIPTHLWASHPRIHVFDRPRTFLHRAGGVVVSLSGLPFLRDVRQRFPEAVEATGYRQVAADWRFLCLHQAVEGARVGPADFTFRNGSDVIRAADLPAAFEAVLSGHIHRAQVLTHDLRRQPLASPVVYPGSVERTSWAEREETKAYAILALKAAARRWVLEWSPLPARDMIDVRVGPSPGRETLEAELQNHLHRVPSDAVVRVHLRGGWSRGAEMALSAANLRRLAPSTMNISLHRPASR
jgi:DNA repair exonuclease SbcCD nuclease subunit